ncbi:MAG: DegV family protein [Actinomycetota bacterium]|nr:DegV family protein [Actinomycetota bacterium]
MSGRFASRVAVVTDSTASLPTALVAERGITVVPLQVVIGGTSYEEVTPAELAAALKEWTPLSTSRPSPESVLAVYQRLAADADEIVSVHLSSELSGTFESVQLAARQSPVPVVTVDSRQVGMGTGFAVLTAAEAAAAGASAAEAGEAARRRVIGTTSLFYVDTLEHLRRGGRVGTAAALVGSALSVKPILSVQDGRITPYERVRTSAKALARLAELAVQAAGEGPVDVAVAHLASPERAGQLAERLGADLADRLQGRELVVGEIGAVLGAHVGPGMVAVTVAPR